MQLESKSMCQPTRSSHLRRGFTGKAKTVLVFGEDESATAVMSTVTARVNHARGAPRIQVSGKCVFDDANMQHYLETVIRVVDGICTKLGRRKKHFCLSVANLGAAAAMDVGIRVAGMSADVPVFLALLSAALHIALPEDLVSTGHMASLLGDIRIVRHIPAKLKAAVDDPSVKTFLYPSLDDDISLDRLVPDQKARIGGAVARAKFELHVLPIANVYDLVRLAFSEDDISIGSLHSGFFNYAGARRVDGNGLERSAHHLARDGDTRLTQALAASLLAGDTSRAKRFLSAYVHFHVRRHRYPSGFGARLLALLHSLPPATMRIRLEFPLVQPQDCILLSQFARESDHEDLRLLYQAAGRLPPPAAASSHRSPPRTSAEAETFAEHSLAAILDEIDAEHLAAEIGLPIDSARASYTMGSVTMASNEEFLSVIASFYQHLLLHIGATSSASDPSAAASDAYDLLNTAFSRQGGAKAALAEAMTGSNGAMRYVLDQLTETFKREQQEKHVMRVFKEAIDPMDWDGKVAFVQAFLTRYATELPPEITSAPPERFVDSHELILRTYVQSRGQLKQLLRSL